MDNKQDKILEIKFVGHIVDEKDLTKPEFAGLGIGTPILVAFTRTEEHIRAVQVKQFELHVVQDDETRCGQKPGDVVVVMEDGKYAAIGEMNAKLSEAIKNDLFQENGPIKLDDEALAQVVGGKIKFSWKNLIRFTVAVATCNVGGIAADLFITGATTVAESIVAFKKNDSSRVDKVVQPWIDLLPFDISIDWDKVK